MNEGLCLSVPAHHRSAKWHSSVTAHRCGPHYSHWFICLVIPHFTSHAHWKQRQWKQKQEVNLSAQFGNNWQAMREYAGVSTGQEITSAVGETVKPQTTFIWLSVPLSLWLIYVHCFWLWWAGLCTWSKTARKVHKSELNIWRRAVRWAFNPISWSQFHVTQVWPLETYRKSKVQRFQIKTTDSLGGEVPKSSYQVDVL